MTAIELDRPRAGRPFGWWAKRITLASLAGAAVLAAGAAAAAWVTKARLAAAHPPPGVMVDIGGRRLHLDCRGEGPQTVILESGNADFSVHWARVQPEIARFARVCAYDRAGLGWSEPSGQPPSPAARIDDLARLLATAGIDGPLVLVGHSYGGLLMRLFAERHRDRVRGIVLVDAAHPDQMQRLPGLAAAVETTAGQFRSLAALARFGGLAFTPGSIPNPGLPPAAQADYAAVMATSGTFAEAAAETAALPASLAAAAGIGDIGALPLTVISRGRTASGSPASADDRFEAAWQALQADLAGLSTNARQVTANGSGHYVQLDEPGLVVDAVAEMLGR